MVNQLYPGLVDELSGNINVSVYYKPLACAICVMYRTSTSWVRVGNWRTNPGKNDGLFQTGSQFNPTTGYYTVSTPG